MVSDFFDFSVYVDVEEHLVKEWYINRFLTFRDSVFRAPGAYFADYAKLNEAEAIDTATQIWNTINLVNLRENIYPTRQRADLILHKSENHAITLLIKSTCVNCSKRQQTAGRVRSSRHSAAQTPG